MPTSIDQALNLSDTEVVIFGILSAIIVVVAFLFFRKNDSDIKFTNFVDRIWKRGFWGSLDDKDNYNVDKNDKDKNDLENNKDQN